VVCDSEVTSVINQIKNDISKWGNVTHTNVSSNLLRLGFERQTSWQSYRLSGSFNDQQRALSSCGLNDYGDLVGAAQSQDISLPATDDFLTAGERQALINTLSGYGWDGLVNDLSNGRNIHSILSELSQGELSGLKATLEPLGWVGLVELINGYISQDGGNNGVTPPPPPSPSSSFGSITSVNHSFAGNEIRVNVGVYNPTNETQEYRVFLYTLDGRLADKEPDLSWKNVKSGQSATIEVNTIGGFFSNKDFQQGYVIELQLQGGVVLAAFETDLQAGAIMPHTGFNPDDVPPPPPYTPSFSGGLPPNGGGFFDPFNRNLSHTRIIGRDLLIVQARRTKNRRRIN